MSLFNEYQKNKFVLLSTLIIFSIVVFYLATIQETNGFHYRIVAAAEATLSTGEFLRPGGEPNSLDFSGYIMIHLVLLSVLDLNAQTVQLLPIGIVIVPFVWAILIKQFTSDIRVIAGFTAPLILAPSFITGHFSTFAYTWSRILYLSALLCVVIFLTKRSAATSRRGIVLVLTILTLGLSNTYWTSTAWLAINLSILAFILFIIGDNRTSEVAGLGIIAWIALLMIPTILRTLVQIFVLQAYDGPLEGLQGFAQTIAHLLGMDSQEAATQERPTVTPSWIEQIGASIWGISRLMRHGVIYFTTVILGLLLMRGHYRGNRSLTWSTAFVAMIVATAAIHSMVYLARGNLSLRYAGLVFPIVILVLAWELDRPDTVLIVGICLALISIVAFAGFVGVSGMETKAAYDSTEGSGEWISEFSSDTRVLGDLHSIEAMRVQTAQSDSPVSRVYFNEEQYDWVVSGRGEPSDAAYVIVNEGRHSQTITTVGWGGNFPPFLAYHSSPEDLAIYHNRSSVYNNGKVNVFSN